MKFIFGVLTGILVSAAVFVIGLYPEIKSNWHHQGYNDGMISAHRKVMDTISSEFGRVEYDESYKFLLGVKSSAVYIIDRDGHKTLGVVE